MKNNYIFLILIILILALGGYFIFIQNIKNQDIKNKEEKTMTIIKTNFGNITLELFTVDAPKTTENFINLANSDFYDGVKFHRVIKGFMIQSGDPLTKDDSKKDIWGTGGPGYVFDDEIHVNNQNIIGSIAMANAGANTNGSQFFINTANNNFLDTKHTVFGKVISGMNVVAAIENTPVEGPNRPIDAVIIENIKILNKNSK